jgi:hypothetical protein
MKMRRNYDRLKQLVAELNLDRKMLQDVHARK